MRKKIQYDVPANAGSIAITVRSAAAVVQLHHLIKGVFRIFIIGIERVSRELGSRVEIFRGLWKEGGGGEKSRRYESMR